MTGVFPGSSRYVAPAVTLAVTVSPGSTRMRRDEPPSTGSRVTVAASAPVFATAIWGEGPDGTATSVGYTKPDDLYTDLKAGKIDAVFGHDDPMALGALEAIKAQGRQGEIKVFGVNGNKEACAAIKNGEMYGTALQMSYLVGVYTVRAAYDVTNGRLIPRTILAPTAAVTPDTVDNWMAQCW